MPPVFHHSLTHSGMMQHQVIFSLGLHSRLYHLHYDQIHSGNMTQCVLFWVSNFTFSLYVHTFVPKCFEASEQLISPCLFFESSRIFIYLLFIALKILSIFCVCAFPLFLRLSFLINVFFTSFLTQLFSVARSFEAKLVLSVTRFD